MTTTAYPKIGIERAAVTLLHTHVRSRRTVKPRYQNATPPTSASTRSGRPNSAAPPARPRRKRQA